MNLAHIFKSLFRRNVTTVKVRSGSFRFIGEPTGDADIVKKRLSDVLKHDPQLRKAYFALIQYQSEEQPRLVLCVDTNSSRSHVMKALVAGCADFMRSIDTMFFTDLHQHKIDELKAVAEPFLVND